jgi:hypothetical protein
MILRSLPTRNDEQKMPPEAQAASAVFLQTEQQVRPPYAVIFQAEHSQLAGELAKALREEIFGDLHPEAIQAAGQHDLGWNQSDTAQMEQLGQTELRPFPALRTAETLPSWRRSIEHEANAAPLVHVLVSRHFCLLGAGDPERAAFIQNETERREDIERILPIAPADLDRWTGAVGFCDLLSLYLCSGSQEPAEFPLTHPAAPDAAQAPKVTLFWNEDRPQFSKPILKPGAKLSLAVRQYQGEGKETTPYTLQWNFVAS